MVDIARTGLTRKWRHRTVRSPRSHAVGLVPLPSRGSEVTTRFVNDAFPYLNQLHDRARRISRNDVDAEDLLQETMLRAYSGFDALSGGTGLLAWLFQLMTETYINGLRRERRRPGDYLLDHIAEGVSAPPGDQPRRRVKRLTGG